ncbi:glycosyltransferase family 10 domain-containing protein [Aporhodopirellula aestuarii]|uniref:Glycosyltransferase family 10 n=1 Tax=Aporhodopirellula aestuarii TaxID=2950107 RepID=A0ABT0U5S8_9BACT|nr:glycosyltransferase family 10 [Aporhodopirellula aestuarii]MCM2372201.1 glycosyltransferase family 10 [Aporhodopirellula aestuarii]
MPRVLLSSCCPNWPLLRQTPGSLGIWEDFEFVMGPSAEDVDACVVLDNPVSSMAVTCCPQNTFFLSWEPPEIRTFNATFLNQFRWIQTCHPTGHPGLIESQQSHPWHVGVDSDHGFAPVLDYDALHAMPRPEKSGLISVAISAKATTPAHRQRLEFVKHLKRRLGDQFHIYGRGHQSISDKWAALGNYRYHIAMENASRPNYITEKLSDAFLGHCFPFYFGAPNATDFFPEGSFQPIDIFNIDEAIEIICDGIQSDLDVVRRHEAEAARLAVLDELNLFPMLVGLLREKMVQGPKQTFTVYPKKHRIKIGVSNLSRVFRKAA